MPHSSKLMFDFSFKSVMKSSIAKFTVRLNGLLDTLCITCVQRLIKCWNKVSAHLHTSRPVVNGKTFHRILSEWNVHMGTLVKWNLLNWTNSLAYSLSHGQFGVYVCSVGNRDISSSLFQRLHQIESKNQSRNIILFVIGKNDVWHERSARSFMNYGKFMELLSAFKSRRK